MASDLPCAGVCYFTQIMVGIEVVVVVGVIDRASFLLPDDLKENNFLLTDFGLVAFI